MATPLMFATASKLKTLLPTTYIMTMGCEITCVIALPTQSSTMRTKSVLKYLCDGPMQDVIQALPDALTLSTAKAPGRETGGCELPIRIFPAFKGNVPPNIFAASCIRAVPSTVAYRSPPSIRCCDEMLPNPYTNHKETKTTGHAFVDPAGPV